MKKESAASSRPLLPDTGSSNVCQPQVSRGASRAGKSGTKTEEWRALIEFVVSLGVFLLLEEFLLPYPELTRARIEVGTVLILSNLWWLFEGVAAARAYRR